MFIFGEFSVTEPDLCNALFQPALTYELNLRAAQVFSNLRLAQQFSDLLGLYVFFDFFDFDLLIDKDGARLVYYLLSFL